MRRRAADVQGLRRRSAAPRHRGTPGNVFFRGFLKFLPTVTVTMPLGVPRPLAMLGSQKLKGIQHQKLKNTTTGPTRRSSSHESRMYDNARIPDNHSKGLTQFWFLVPWRCIPMDLPSNAMAAISKGPPHLLSPYAWDLRSKVWCQKVYFHVPKTATSQLQFSKDRICTCRFQFERCCLR